MKNKFCPRWDSNPRPPAFAASILTARPPGPHGRERTTPRLILKHLESISGIKTPSRCFNISLSVFVLYREAIVV